MVNVLMLKNLRGLKGAVEILREHKGTVTGIDFEWERDGLLGEYDVEVGFSDSEAEYESKWVMRANQWCKVSERGFFGTLLRKKDLDLNFLIRTILKNQNSSQLVVGGGADEVRLRKEYFEVQREYMSLIRFIRPQFDKKNMVIVLKNPNRLFDKFGWYQKSRNPDLTVFVKWKGLVWVDGKICREEDVEIPLIGANEELKEIRRILFEANYIEGKRNPRQAKALMPKHMCEVSKEGKRERFLVKMGIEKPLTDYF